MAMVATFSLPITVENGVDEMNEFKYQEGQRVEFRAGGEARKSLYGEWGVGRITKIKNGICHLSTPFGDEIMRMVDDIRPIPADELQALRAENERLRGALTDLSTRILPTLYSDAPTESVASLLYYLSAMATEIKIVVDEATK